MAVASLKAAKGGAILYPDDTAEFASFKFMKEGWDAKVKELAPDTKVVPLPWTVSEVGPKLEAKVQAAILKNPDITVVDAAVNPALGFSTRGGDGQGPGGGMGNIYCTPPGWAISDYYGRGGSGGGFGSDGAKGSNNFRCNPVGEGKSYGNYQLQPLIGGSGGGGSGGTRYYVRGIAGGGGGGALLLAVTGTVNVTGKILANGGSSGKNGAISGYQSNNDSFSEGGGGGSIQ